MMLFFKTNKISSKVIIIIIIIIFIIAFLAWLFIESSKPLPGTKVDDLGRGHVEIGKEIEYNSNPPTSGPHYADWIRAGVYDTQRDDRNLVHSLEHGYVIMHYKCKLEPRPLIPEIVGEATPASVTSPSADTKQTCQDRKDKLSQIYEKKGKRKLIVVPRLAMDTNFALTAWTYLDKFDEFDKTRIERFIDAHLDNGPEKTMEP